jgi:hypothetical protein
VHHELPPECAPGPVINAEKNEDRRPHSALIENWNESRLFAIIPEMERA